VLPETVTAIGEAAFEYCIALQKVVIPSRVVVAVVTIGSGAFLDCESQVDGTLHLCAIGEGVSKARGSGERMITGNGRGGIGWTTPPHALGGHGWITRLTLVDAQPRDLSPRLVSELEKCLALGAQVVSAELAGAHFGRFAE
jgi:hypothetical protein